MKTMRPYVFILLAFLLLGTSTVRAAEPIRLGLIGDNIATRNPLHQTKRLRFRHAAPQRLAVKARQGTQLPQAGGAHDRKFWRGIGKTAPTHQEVNQQDLDGGLVLVRALEEFGYVIDDALRMVR